MTGFREYLWMGARPLLRLYWRVARPLTAGVRAIVLDGEGRILLVRHTYIKGWYLPGGGVGRNETMQAALRRELDEEAGVEVRDAMALVGLYANFREFKSDHVALYALPHGAYAIEPRRSPEIAEIGFFAPDALPDGTTDATRNRILEYLGKRAPAEMW